MKSIERLFLPVVFALCASLPVDAQLPPTKQVVAPPSDILSGLVRLPDPASTPTGTCGFLAPLAFERGAQGWSAQTRLALEQRGPLRIALLSPGAADLTLEIDGIALHTQLLSAGDDFPGWMLLAGECADAPAGELALRVSCRGERTPAECWAVMRGAGALELECWVDTQELVSDGPVGVAAQLAHAPPGTQVDFTRLTLECEGRTADVAFTAGDPSRALVPAGWSGEVRARVEFGGSLPDGERFVRSTPLAFPLRPRACLFDGSVRVEGREIVVGALPLAPAERLHFSAELWGSDARGALVPVCWLSRMLEPRRAGERWEFPLELDPVWIGAANATAPFELRELRVQDPDSEVVYDRLARLALTDELPRAAAQTAGTHAPAGPLVVINPALMLVHGYCSGGSIWPAADFTQPKRQFLDPNANRTHDQFAQLLASQAQGFGLGSFGVVAHSQGGCAALHLLTYYTSGLDYATGTRLIQSVATPYQGTPLASLGGFSCGVNNDMTPAGSAAWLAGIPSAARAQVWYWTVSNSGSACNFLTDFLLTNPEDGVVEQFRGQLPGGNNMGHTTGWCHTTGMTNPACYTDHTRNQGMDSAAAR